MCSHLYDLCAEPVQSASRQKLDVNVKFIGDAVYVCIPAQSPCHCSRRAERSHRARVRTVLPVASGLPRKFAIGASAPRLLPWHRTHAHSGFCKPGVAGCGACHEWPFVLMSIFPLTTIPTPCHWSVPRIPISDLCACGFHLRAVPEWP